MVCSYQGLQTNVVQYFTNPESIEPADFPLLDPFVDSALSVALRVTVLGLPMYVQ